MRTRSHSPAPSGPRLSQMEFDTPSRPSPWTSPARRSVDQVARRQLRAAPRRRRRAPTTARAWPSMYGDLRSTKSATATSAASNCCPRQLDAERGLGRDHRVPGLRRRRGRPGSPRRSRTATPRASGSNCAPARLRASAAAASTRRCGGPPRRTRPSAPAATAIGTASPLSSPGHPCRPTARTTRRPPAAPRRAARAARPATGPAPSAGRSSRRVRDARPARTPDPTRKRCSGGLPDPIMRRGRRRASEAAHARGRTCRTLSAMSSPNHLACSWASEWQPTLTSSAV